MSQQRPGYIGGEEAKPEALKLYEQLTVTIERSTLSELLIRRLDISQFGFMKWTLGHKVFNEDTEKSILELLTKVKLNPKAFPSLRPVVKVVPVKSNRGGAGSPQASAARDPNKPKTDFELSHEKALSFFQNLRVQ